MWTVGLVGHHGRSHGETYQKAMDMENPPTRNVDHFLGHGLRETAASPPGNSHTSNLSGPNFDGQYAQYQTEFIGSPLGPKNEL